jgi:hypothetical protein
LGLYEHFLLDSHFKHNVIMNNACFWCPIVSSCFIQVKLTHWGVLSKLSAHASYNWVQLVLNFLFGPQYCTFEN